MNRLLRAVLLAALATVAVGAQAQEFFMARSGLNFRILKIEAVLQEMKVAPETKPKVADLVGQLEQKMMIQISGGDPEDIRAQIQEQMDSVERFGRAELKKMLSAEQYQRFDELNWQSLGIDAFSVPSARRAFNLSADQNQAVDSEIAKITQLTQRLYESSASHDGDGQVTFHLTKEQEVELRTAKLNALQGVLSKLDDAQRTQWAQMTGPKFEFDWGQIRAQVQARRA